MLNEIVAVALVVALALWWRRSALPFEGLCLAATLLLIPAVTVLADYGLWPGGATAANTTLQLLVLAAVWLFLLGILGIVRNHRHLNDN